ncbi:MAG: hypothetical protein K2X87_11865 [Gemmataceae bacterium]|nr:hypothetical protein [Gemmataceae bacterium]
MTPTPTPTPTAPARTFRRRWADFWFAPSDPTTLGFIRVVTGLLLLYIHLTYSLDLQAFFGKYGWYGVRYIDRERHEYPHYLPSFWNWDESDQVGARVPEFPHRKEAVLRFIRSLPEGSEARARALRYLDRLTRLENGDTLAGLTFAERLAKMLGPDDRPRMLAALRGGRQQFAYADEGQHVYADKPHETRQSIPVIPDFLLALPPAEREVVAADLTAFLAVLPPDPTDARYVLAHLMELGPEQRRALVQFTLALPEDPAERERLTEYLGHWNADPRFVQGQGHVLVSAWFHVTDPTAMAAVHALVLLVMALFTVGAFTRVTGVLTWIAVVGYLHRTNQILFGMDTMMNILLVYLVVGNSGAALSVDRLVARYRAARASLRRCGRIDGPTRAFLDRPPPSSGANLGIRLIQVHFCFIYLAAGLSKLKGPGWWSGNAIWDVMVNPEFTLLRYDWFEAAFRGVASIKPVYHAATAFGVWFTWGLEVAFPFLVWTRLRPLMVWMGVLLHAGIGVLMGLNLFELLMMTMLLVFFPAGVIRDRLRGGPGLPKLGFGFDSADARQARAAAVVAAADIDAQVAVEPGKGKALPVLTAADGSTVAGPAAVGKLFGSLRLLRLVRLVAYIPGVSGLVARLLFPGTKPPTNPVNGPRAAATAS